VEVAFFLNGRRAENAAPVNLEMKAYSCEGRLLPIAENDRLFELLGATYIRNGQETFAIPDLTGRAPTNAGRISDISANCQFGEKVGIEKVRLMVDQYSKYLPTGDSNWGIRSSEQEGSSGRKEESTEAGSGQSERLEEPLERKPAGVGYPPVTFEVRPNSVVVVSQWHSLGNAASAGEERIQ
jgi:Phage Tail Collar Domain